MTKYILIGGYPYKALDGGITLCQEAIGGFSQPVKILICAFARHQKDWEKYYKKQKQFFTNNLPEIILNFTLANESDFINQIKSTNLLYFGGGDTTDLINKLKRNPEWVKVLDGKTVMGSSAGADLLSTYNYDFEHLKCADGFGLVPVKTIVHYQSKDYAPPIGWETIYKEIKKYKQDLPIWTLREGEHKTINI